MNIYIPIEIKARELEGRSLLAFAAAERGHTVILGEKKDTRGLCTKGILPPGILHEKSLTPSDSTIAYFSELIKDGYVITSQDEEAGVTMEDYEEFGKGRYSEGSVSLAEKIFCWGEHDAGSLKSTYPEYADKFVATGSPRVDYWRKEFQSYFKKETHLHEKEYGRYILIPTNFSLLFGRDKFWNILARQRRAGYFERDKNREYNIFHSQSDRLRLAGEYVKMIRRLSKEFPDILILIRPHPIELEDAWEKMIGEYPNVMVLKKGGAGSWIRHCSLLINNGCTTALEAAAVDVPRIAYKPFHSDYEEVIPNKVCHTVTSVEEMVGAVSNILNGKNLDDIESVNKLTNEILENRFANLTGKFAADRIVNEWERIDHPVHNIQSAVDELMELKKAKKASIFRHLKRKIATIKNAVINKKEKSSNSEKLLFNPHKFPSFTDHDMETLHSNLKSSLDRFHNVRYQRFGKKSFILYSD